MDSIWKQVDEVAAKLAAVRLQAEQDEELRYWRMVWRLERLNTIANPDGDRWPSKEQISSQ